MSVVAWDGTHLAADRQATNDQGRISLATKIRQLANGVIVAGVGSHIECLVLMNWYEAGADPKEWPDFQKPGDFNTLIVVEARNRVYEYHHLIHARRAEDYQMAWGAGASFAIGAMEAGADACRAVEIASQYSCDCGLGVVRFKAKEG